jgi:hypothetical protein
MSIRGIRVIRRVLDVFGEWQGRLDLVRVGLNPRAEPQLV